MTGGHSSLVEFVNRLGVDLDPQLLERALVHRSFAYENGNVPTNERLEFLGDSVLGLVVTDTLYRRFPDLPEGQLAKLRAAVVNMRALASVARRYGLGEQVRLGKGEESTGGRNKESILADTLEAVIGATYLSVGIEAASQVVHRLIDPLIEVAAKLGAGLDWKTSLQELTAARGLGVPSYEIVDSGPDHAKVFQATAIVDGRACGVGEGRSKKVAEQEAAERAWHLLKDENHGLSNGHGAGSRLGAAAGAHTPPADAPAVDLGGSHEGGPVSTQTAG